MHFSTTFLRAQSFLFLLPFTLLVYGQNTTSPCVNAGDCYPEVTPDNALATWLFGWDKCTTTGIGAANQKSWINAGYDDQQTMANIDGVYQNIPWNSAAANEFFGPENALGTGVKKQVQSEMINFNEICQIFAYIL